MKNLYIIIVLLISTITQAQIVNIPDANFKDALLSTTADFDGDGVTDGSTDTNNDGEIQVSEAEAVLGLKFFPFHEITSLEGIESFINLEWLELFGHDLGVLDLSQNSHLEILKCSHNNISNLTLPQNSSLIEIDCDHNNLTSLDVSQCSNLRLLRCVYNEIVDVDLTNNPDLEWLIIYQNQLQSLDITNNVALEVFSCFYNYIDNLDFSQNPNLIQISVGYNLLTSLDVTQNLNLQYLQFGSNQISSLNVTQNSELILLEGVYNDISEIDLSQNINLQGFNLVYNQLTSLDVSSNINLINFNCKGNLLTSLNIQNGNNLNMHQMWAYDNPDLTCIQVDDEDFDNYPLCDYWFSYGWCYDTGLIFSEDCENLNVDDKTNINFTIFPNPTKNTLFIESQEPIETVKIFNPQGQFIKKEETSTSRIDVSSLASGLYFIQVTVAGISETKKFVKE